LLFLFFNDCAVNLNRCILILYGIWGLEIIPYFGTFSEIRKKRVIIVLLLSLRNCSVSLFRISMVSSASQLVICQVIVDEFVFGGKEDLK